MGTPLLDSNGNTITVAELAKRAGASCMTIRRRLKEGAALEDILRAPFLRYEKDITGQVFNRLTVLKIYDKRRRRRNIQWLCECTCGKQCKVLSHDLRSGRQRSCGCLKSERARQILGTGQDLIGQTFSRLTVLEACVLVRSNGAKKRTWKCLCVCGNTVNDVLTGSLTAKLTQSCGCLKKADRQRKFLIFGESITIQEMAELAKVGVGAIYRRLRTTPPEECIQGPQKSGPPKGQPLKKTDRGQ